MSEQEPTQAERVTRIVEFKIRLEWLLAVSAGLAFTLVNMYFSLNVLVRTVGDLQIDVKAGNNSIVAVAGELALIKYRVANSEANIASLSETVKKGNR